MFGWFFGKDETNSTVTTNGQEIISQEPTVKEPTKEDLAKKFKSDLSKSLIQICKDVAYLHKLQGSKLESKFLSEYDDSFQSKFETYSSRTRVNLYKYNSSGEELHDRIRNVFYGYIEGSKVDSSANFDEIIMMTPSTHDDILLHLESIHGQVKAEIETYKDSAEALFTIQKTVRIWYKHSEEAIASNPKHKDKFKRIVSNDPKYADFDGRFVLKIKSTTDINRMIELFPTADYIEIWHPELSGFEAANMDNLKGIFVF